MNKDTKKAFIELLRATREQLKNKDDSSIKYFMPEVGTFWTEEKDCDENGNWGFVNSYVTISEEDAISEAQDLMINNKDQSFFDEFIFEGELRVPMLNFMRELCKDIAKC